MKQHSIYLILRISGHVTWPVTWRHTKEEADELAMQMMLESQDLRHMHVDYPTHDPISDDELSRLKDQTIKSYHEHSPAFYMVVSVSDDSAYTQGGRLFRDGNNPPA